ncbi:MAG TPA: DUF1707 and DUF4190 domain-containing protein [Streptosporangiaceae bacterium]|nr:DUF1707 and DUF4190 domain-containing protein [Streptosporangiaceae bacterium]
MTAGGYGYGSMRVTDADRENVRTILADAHTQGRLSWEEFDSRSTALVNAQTYDQLTGLTADLPNRMPATPPQVFGYQGGGNQAGFQGAGYPSGYPQGGFPGNGPFGPVATTNGMAIAALVLGVVQIFGFWVFSGIPAIILGHIARRRIQMTGEQGAGMALAGMILGYVGLAFALLFVLAIVIGIAVASKNGAFQQAPSP